MSFQIQIVDNVPISREADLDDALRLFLSNIGYLLREKETDVAVGLFKTFLLLPNKFWTVEEMMHRLNTSKPTLYYHLNKLKSLDLIEGNMVELEGYEKKKKVYSLRFKNLERAWHFVEYHIEDSLKNYGKSITNIWSIAERVREKTLENEGL